MASDSTFLTTAFSSFVHVMLRACAAATDSSEAVEKKAQQFESTAQQYGSTAYLCERAERHRADDAVCHICHEAHVIRTAEVRLYSHSGTKSCIRIKLSNKQRVGVA